MTEIAGREVRLVARPKGDPKPSDFAVADTTAPAPARGQVQVRTRWISVDPMIRIFIDAEPLGGTIPPLPLGEFPRGPAVAEVTASEHPNFRPGDYVEGRIGWREVATLDGGMLRRVDPAAGPLSSFLGVLGLPGFSAYVGLTLIDGLGPGRTMLVSGAGGAVGSVVGPLARLDGVRTVGIAAGEARCRALVGQIGYDLALDRTAPDFADRLAAASEGGFDVFFDNIGGEMFSRILPLMRRGGQVLICGLMAQYGGGGAASTDKLPGALQAIMGRGLTVRAFSNVEHLHLLDRFQTDVGKLLEAGRLPSLESVSEGIETVATAFCRLFTDSVLGKSLVRIP